MKVGSRAPSLLRAHSPLLVFLAPSIASNLPVAALRLCSTYIGIACAGPDRRPIKIRRGLRQASSAAAPTPQQQSSDESRTEPRLQPLLRPLRQSPDAFKKRQTSLLDKFKTPSKNIQGPMSAEDRTRQIDNLLDRSRDPSAIHANSPPTSTMFNRYPDESSADMLERKRAESRRQDFAAAQGQDSRQGSIARQMMMPPRNFNANQQDMIHLQEPTRAIATIKSRPSLGRTVEVMPERGLDLGRALRSLEINCAVNNVRGDAQTQRFHERPGMKRKRLHSLRWRRRFKIGFKAVVGKVKAMRRKGW